MIIAINISIKWIGLVRKMYLYCKNDVNKIWNKIFETVYYLLYLPLNYHWINNFIEYFLQTYKRFYNFISFW